MVPEANYLFGVRADYFCRWLLGDFDPNVDLTEEDAKPQPNNGAARRTQSAESDDDR